MRPALYKRDALDAELGIGYGNAKFLFPEKMLQRLNDYRVTWKNIYGGGSKISKELYGTTNPVIATRKSPVTSCIL